LTKGKFQKLSGFELSKTGFLCYDVKHMNLHQLIYSKVILIDLDRYGHGVCVF